jgi:hypothetical protein
VTCGWFHFNGTGAPPPQGPSYSKFFFLLDGRNFLLLRFAFKNDGFFSGDYFGQKCRSGKKLDDVFNDYLDFTKGVAYDTSNITWRLNNFVTSEEY